MQNNTKALFSTPALLLLLLLSSSLIGAILIFSCILQTDILAPITQRNKLLPEDLNHVYISSPTRFNVVCYLTLPGKNDSTNRLQPDKVDPNLCTHIIVGFASIVNCTLNLGDNIKFFTDAVGLKRKNSELKVMVSVGGGNEISSGFPQMTKNHANRKIFIRSVLAATKTLGLDGLDVDWEFPGWLEPNGRQRIHFVQLLQELKKAFDKSNRRLVLSAAVAASQTIIDLGYNIPEIAEHVDFVNLMSYDYHFYSILLPFTGLNAPLYPSAAENGLLSTLNVNFSSEYWVENGMPREKIIVGIPTYGHSYALDNSENHGLNAPCRGFGSLGSFGFVTYSTVCNFLANSATRVFENSSKVPYAYRATDWISYDDIVSVTIKAEWIRSAGFGGAMIFSLNTDDWNATCDGKSLFPLTRAIIKIIGN